MNQKNDDAKGQKREHLRREERNIIERMLRHGADKGEIARTLRRDKSTIKREVRRGAVVQRVKKPYQSRKWKVPQYLERKVYRAEAGQEAYERHRQQGGAKNRAVICSEPVAYVEGKVPGKQKWSVDDAAPPDGGVKNLSSRQTARRDVCGYRLCP